MGIDSALRAAYQAGVLLCGASAGAICWYEAAFDGFWRPVSSPSPAANRSAECQSGGWRMPSLRAGLEKLGPLRRETAVEVNCHARLCILPPQRWARFICEPSQLAVTMAASLCGLANLSILPSVPANPNRSWGRPHHGSRRRHPAILLADLFYRNGRPSFDYGPLFPELPAAGRQAPSCYPVAAAINGKTPRSCLSRCSTRRRERVVFTTPSFAR